MSYPDIKEAVEFALCNEDYHCWEVGDPYEIEEYNDWVYCYIDIAFIRSNFKTTLRIRRSLIEADYDIHIYKFQVYEDVFYDIDDIWPYLFFESQREF